MRTIILHPTVAERSCDDCRKYLYDDSKTRMGERIIRRELPVLRLPNQRPPCHWCPKIPAEARPIPENAIELSEKNTAAYLHYLQCRAIGQFPDDPIVRRNAVVIRQVEDLAKEVGAIKGQGLALMMALSRKAT